MMYIVKSIIISIIYAQIIFSFSALAGETVLTLEKALSLAVKNENSLIAQQRIVQAQNARKRARAAFLPLLKATGTYTRNNQEIVAANRVIQRQHTVDASASVVMTLFKGSNYFEAAEARIFAYSEKKMVTWQKNLIAFETAHTYFSVLAARQLLSTAEKNKKTALDFFEAVTARVEAGEAIDLDKTRAQLEVVGAKEAVIRAQNTMENVMDYLGLLINKAPPFELAAIEVMPMKKDSARSYEDLALENRQDLSALRREIEARKKGVQGSKMTYLPTLTSSLNYRVSQNTGWSGDYDSWNMMLVLDWIIFDGGLRSSNIRDKKSLEVIARYQESLLKREISTELRQALREVESADAVLGTAREKIKLAEYNREAVHARFGAGLATSLEVVLADSEFVQSQTDAIIEELNLSLKRLTLLKILGLDPLGMEVSAR